MFGPVLVADAVRTSRRGRHLIFRCVILGVLLLLLMVLYVGHFRGIDGILRPTALPPNEVARFAQQFFELFMLVQLGAVIFLTPAYAGGAISEEREKKTLDFLLASSLNNHEIVLGKLASRLGSVGLVVLTGLPLLSLLQLLGGVDPNLVLAGYVVTLMSMLSLGSLGVMVSVFSGRSLAAILLTYLVAGLYFVVTTVLHLTGVAPPVLQNLVCGGNVLVAYSQIGALTSGGVVAGELWRVTLVFTLFHLALSLTCLETAVLALRRWSMATASSGQRWSYVVGLSRRRKRLPPVPGTDPMLWKELHAEPVFRLNRPGMIAVSTLITAFLIMGSTALLLGAVQGLVTWGGGGSMVQFSREMNTFVRTMGTIFGSALLAVLAVRAATCLSGERDRQTLDSLLALPLGDREILGAKWWGSLLCTRKLWWFLAAVWLVGVVTGGLSLTAIPCVVFGWLTFAAFLVSLGLWLSLTCKSTLRAVTIMLFTLLGLTVGPWLVGEILDRLIPQLPANLWGLTLLLGATCWVVLFIVSALVWISTLPRKGTMIRTRILLLVMILFLSLIALVGGLTTVGMVIDPRLNSTGTYRPSRDILQLALSPPANLWAKSYCEHDWDRYDIWSGGYGDNLGYWTWLITALVGQGFYGVLAWMLWKASSWRFPHVTGRMLEEI